MESDERKQQVLLRLSGALVDLLKKKAKEEGMGLARFCERYLELIKFLDLQPSNGQIKTRQTRHRLILIPAVQYNEMYGANATYREGRRLGLEWAPLLSEISVEDTLALFSLYGWGIFEFQAEKERIINFNPPISSAEFIRGLIEGLTGLSLGILTADREVFVYQIKV